MKTKGVIIISVLFTLVIYLLKYNQEVFFIIICKDLKRSLATTITFTSQDKIDVCSSINITTAFGAAYINSLTNTTQSYSTYIQTNIDMTLANNSASVK